MTDIATHIRIFDLTPSDELVEKRTEAIKRISTNFIKSQSVLRIFQWANDVARAVEADRRLSENLGELIETEIRRSAKAFIGDGEELQMIVCGLLAARRLLTSSRPRPENRWKLEAIAIGLWCALSFQATNSHEKIEALRRELLGEARNIALAKANDARKRLAVPDVEFELPVNYHVPTLRRALGSAPRVTIAALRTNALLDREEIDLLWWVLADWSDLLGQRISTAENREAIAVASGIEAGRLIRHLPVDAHRNLVLRNISETGPLSLNGLLQALGDDREQLANASERNSRIATCPAIFPLLSALQSGLATGPNAEIERSVEEWAIRALLETAALHFANLPHGVTA